MDISRKLALEIFGLQDGKYTECDLNSAYRKLSKIAHPDSGGNSTLFIFITECRNMLLVQPSQEKHENAEKKPTANKKTRKKIVRDISLFDLVSFMNDHFYLEDNVLLNSVFLLVRVSVSPILRRNLNKDYDFCIKSNIADFIRNDLKLVTFNQNVSLSEEHCKYRFFKVTVYAGQKKFKYYAKANTQKTIVSNSAFFKQKIKKYFTTKLNITLQKN